MNIEEQIYERLLKVIPILETIKDYRKSEAPGFMDFHCDILNKNHSHIRIALQHYYKHPSGDLIPDPDMVVDVDTNRKTASAVAFQNAFVYHTVEDCKDPKALRDSMNEFLLMWLKNLADQGHKIE